MGAGIEQRIGTTTVRLIAEGGDWWTVEVRPDDARGWVVQMRGKREAEREYRRRVEAARREARA